MQCTVGDVLLPGTSLHNWPAFGPRQVLFFILQSSILCVYETFYFISREFFSSKEKKFDG